MTFVKYRKEKIENIINQLEQTLIRLDKSCVDLPASNDVTDRILFVTMHNQLCIAKTMQANGAKFMYYPTVEKFKSMTGTSTKYHEFETNGVDTNCVRCNEESGHYRHFGSYYEHTRGK